MRIFQEILDLLKENENSINLKLSEHATTLFDARHQGSTTKYGLNMIPGQTQLTDVTAEFKNILNGDNTKCYRLEAPQLEGRYGVVPIRIVSDDYIEYVRVRKGLHGYELYIDHELFYQDDDDTYTPYIYFIVGDFEGERALFTWHPGTPLDTCKITAETAVKLGSRVG